MLSIETFTGSPYQNIRSELAGSKSLDTAKPKTLSMRLMFALHECCTLCSLLESGGRFRRADNISEFLKSLTSLNITSFFVRRPSFLLQERLVEPVECALVADICSVLLPGTPLDPLDPPSKSPASAAPFLEGFPVTHPRKAPASLGYSLDVRTEGDVRIRLQKSGLEEAQRRWGKKEVAEGESLGAGEEGSARMESRVQQGGESCAQKVVEGDAKSGEQMVMGDPASDVAHGNPAIVLRNDSPVPLHFGQLDTDEALLVCPGGALSYTWAAPPVLVPGAKRKLRVRIAAPSVGEARNDVGPASSWSEAFSLKASDSDGVGRRVVIDGRGVAQLVVKICKGEKGEWNVTVSPGLRFVNRTAGALSIRYRGLLPGGRSDQAELNDGVELMNPRQTRSPSKRDQHAEPKGVEEVEKAGGGNKLQKRSSRNQFASQWHTGERILTIPPTGGKVPGVGVLLVTPRDSDVSGDVSDDERHVAPSVSVLLGSTAEREEAQSEGAIWSPWLGLDNPPQGSPSLHLLTVDTQSTPVRGVQRGLPSVWCQVVSSPEGRLTLTVWPLFMAYNGLHRSVDLRVGEDGFESVSVRISEQEEVPLRALTSGVDSVAFRLAAEGGNSSGTIAALESNQERFGLADERGLPGTDGAATEKELIEGGSGTDIEVGAWSVPLMLAAGASVPGAGGVLESGTIGEDFRIPSLGAVRHLALNGEEKVRLHSHAERWDAT